MNDVRASLTNYLLESSPEGRTWLWLVNFQRDSFKNVHLRTVFFPLGGEGGETMLSQQGGLTTLRRRTSMTG